MSEAYQHKKTYGGFIQEQDRLRHSFKSLLSGMCIDGKIIVIQELLRNLEKAMMNLLNIIYAN